MPKPSKIDLTYAGGLVAVVIVLIALAFFGSSFATFALPFVVGGSIGYGLARFLTEVDDPRWVRAVAVLVAAFALITAGLSLVIPLVNDGANWRPVSAYYSPTSPTSFGLFGFGFVLLSETFKRVVFPSAFPTTAGEAREQKRQRLRGILIVGGLLLAFLALLCLVLAMLAIIVFLIAG